MAGEGGENFAPQGSGIQRAGASAGLRNGADYQVAVCLTAERSQRTGYVG